MFPGCCNTIKILKLGLLFWSETNLILVSIFYIFTNFMILHASTTNLLYELLHTLDNMLVKLKRGETFVSLRAALKKQKQKKQQLKQGYSKTSIILNRIHTTFPAPQIQILAAIVQILWVRYIWLSCQESSVQKVSHEKLKFLNCTQGGIHEQQWNPSDWRNFKKKRLFLTRNLNWPFSGSMHCIQSYHSSGRFWA